MSKHTPSKLQKKIDRLRQAYLDSLEQLANQVFEERIVPYCKEKRLSFVMMNGFPRFVNEQGAYVSTPTFVVNLAELYDDDGTRFIWQLNKEFKFNPVIDFNQVDIDHHNKRSANRPLCEYLFSPAFGL